MGGENDLRGFDIRSVSPVAFLPRQRASSACAIPDGSIVPKDPANPLRGAYTVPVPFEQHCLSRRRFQLGRQPGISHHHRRPGGDRALRGYRRRPDPAKSQLRINSGQLNDINNTAFGCPALDVAFNCVGRHVPETSSEFCSQSGQNQLDPPHVHWPGIAGVPARDQRAIPHLLGLQPAASGHDGYGAGPDHAQHVPCRRRRRLHLPECDRGRSPRTYQLREPRKTFRFTVATTF